ncbi:shugoshin [Zygosaccharomyces mellis]|uniref:Shugoshin n=1 Tax=Zygosaccharomyces mellis TaxID=42258 RepID=A0A4C2E359_9SACH|nr:shugoshin [Zygosaccharomyces mellis]
MAKTIKKRSRGGSSGTAAAGKLAANVSHSVPTPGIQELQDLMDAHQDKIATVKAVYSQQNTQFAKSNSALLMKLTDFEKKISELVQENVVLRSQVSVNEYTYKERLNEQISILEEGMSRRFEEIFHMFDSIRRKENLPSSSTISGIPMESRSILRGKRSRSTSGRTSSIHFQDNDTNKNRIPEDMQAKKKRRSSRRESIFMPEDFQFAYEEDQDQPPIEREPETPLAEPAEISTSLPLLAAQQPSEKERSEMQPEIDEGQAQGTREESVNFTNSIIDYSIPEEAATGGANSNSEAEPPASSKLEIFRDEPEQGTQQNDSTHVIPDNTNQTMKFMPLEASQHKVKHSMRPLNTKSKKMVDEVMPSTNGNVARDLDFPRTRRTRGKAIDYTLPSLRAKMRRPSEKLVDATTFTNIQDLQVTHSDRRSSKGSSRRTTISPEPLPDLRAKSEEFQLQKPPKENVPIERPKMITDNSLEKRPNGGGNENENEDHSISSFSTNTSSGSSGKALKDITNTPKVKQPQKTKKLFKNAIINDLCDQNSNKSQNPRNDRNVSFRLQEEDLSVFDLIGSDKAKYSQKTHRAKSRRKA